MKKLFLIILLFLIIPSQSFSQEGKLKKAKQSLNTTTTKSSGTRTSKSSSSNNNSETSFGAQIAGFFVRLFLLVTYEALIESKYEYEGRMHDAEIAAYPYKKATHGNFIYTDSINYSLARLDISNNFVIENNRLYGNNLNLDFRFLKRMGLEVDYLQLFEKVNKNVQSFSLFSAMLNYHRIRTQKLDVWFGVGAMHVGNNVNKKGFAYGVGGEWFVGKPISILGTYKASTINNRTVSKSKILMKYHINKYHISSGYEHFTLGVSKVNTFSIGVGVSF